MSVENVIIVAAEDFLRKNVGQFLRSKRINCAEVSTISEAHGKLTEGSYDLMLLDDKLSDGCGLEFLQEVNMRPTKPLVVVMGTEVDTGVNAVKEGAHDYLLKPFSNEQIQILIKKTGQFAQVVNVNQYLTQSDKEQPENEILGDHPATEQLRKMIRRVAQTDATVMIQGENGTGKELVARALHNESPRKNGPFIKLNCAAMPENLVESELFGHEKGSFTGATNKREGRFELAHGGTILLDEISEMPLPLQAKLLRVLQEREFERVGGNRTVKVDVRVIAATNRKLEESVEKREFRQDLYFRLNVVPIHVPPLRDRVGDIDLLANAFTQRFIRKHGTQIKGFAPESAAALKAHDWPGNIRELQNVIERAVILCGEDGHIKPDLLGLNSGTPIQLTESDNIAGESVSMHTNGGGVQTLGEIEKAHILAILQECEYNRTQAAKILDINIRTLRNKLNEYKAAGELVDK